MIVFSNPAIKSLHSLLKYTGNNCVAFLLKPLKYLYFIFLSFTYLSIQRKKNDSADHVEIHYLFYTLFMASELWL